MTPRISRGLLVVFGCAVLLAASAWLVGFGTAQLITPPHLAPPQGVQPPSNFALYRDVWRIINSEFYGPKQPNQSEITYDAIEGLVAALNDPYAVFVPAEAAAKAAGQFEPEVVSGVGVWIEPTSDGALIVSVVPDSPADRAGLQPGDRLLAVGDQILSNLERDKVLSLLQGPAGTSVALAVRRGQAAPFSAEVVRADFPLPAVEVRRPTKDVGYLRIASFTPGMVTELDRALASLATDPPAALVVDLRDNPGGDLAVLCEAAARFVQGTLYNEVDRGGKVTPRGTADVEAPKAKVPSRLIVLVNGGTASAAEMLAGTLRDNASAELIGTKTFGKGTIQAVETLADHSLLRFTVAQWTTPSGNKIEGVGLAPDKAVEVTAEDKSAKRDPQLEAAVKAAEASAATAGG